MSRRRARVSADCDCSRLLILEGSTKPGPGASASARPRAQKSGAGGARFALTLRILIQVEFVKKAVGQGSQDDPQHRYEDQPDKHAVSREENLAGCTLGEQVGTNSSNDEGRVQDSVMPLRRLQKDMRQDAYH